MSEFINDLKGDLYSVAEVIGRQKALYLAGQCPKYKVEKRQGTGMVMLYVPKSRKIPSHHNLIEILGYQDAIRMIENFGGELLRFHTKNIILKSRNDGIKTMVSQGFKKEDIAQLFNLSTRAVCLIAAN